MAPSVPIRLVLRGGHSPIPSWPLASVAPGTYLSVGTGPTCQWRVHGPGIQLVHCVLYWDGQTLWVCDPDAAGTQLDGATVNDWVASPPGGTIQFGAASLRVQGAESDSGQVPQPGPPPPDMEDTRRRLANVSAGASPEETALFAPNSPTRPRQTDEKGPSGSGSAVTHIVGGAQKPTGNNPVFGGAALKGSSTRILSAKESSPASSVPPPRISKRSSGSKSDDSPPAAAHLDEPTEAPALEGKRKAPSQQAGESPQSAPSRVGPSDPETNTPATQPAEAQASENQESAGAELSLASSEEGLTGGKFALPPPEKSATRPAQRALRIAKQIFKSKWLRYSLLGLFGVIVLTFGAGKIIAALKSTPAPTGQRPPPAGQPAAPPELPSWARANTTRVPAPPDTLRLDERERPVASAGEEDVRRRVAPPPEKRPTTTRRNRRNEPSLERRAANALRQRDTSKAVELYRELERKFPSNPAFTNILKILEERTQDTPEVFGTPPELREQHIDRRVQEESQRPRRGRRGRSRGRR